MDLDTQMVGKHQEDILLVGSLEVGNHAADNLVVEGMLREDMPREDMPQEEEGTVLEDIHGHHDGHGVRITLCQIHHAYPLHHPCLSAK